MFEGNGTIVNILFSLIAQSEYGTVLKQPRFAAL